MPSLSSRSPGSPVASSPTGASTGTTSPYSPEESTVSHLLTHVLAAYALGMLLPLLVTPKWRKRAFLLLLLGVASHLTLDLLLLKPTGYAFPVLWPLAEYHPPVGMLYRSSDRLPAVLAIILAGAVYLTSRRSASPVTNEQDR